MVDRAVSRQLMKSFMYGHPYRRGNRKLAIAVVLISLLLITLAVTLRSTIVLRAGTAAGNDPLIVFGTVNDSSGVPVEGADVIVTVIGTIVPSPSQSTVSIGGGFYTVTFEGKDWNTGDNVKVGASFGGESGENQTTADSANLEIDVYLVSTIPELHDSVSVMLTVGAMAVLVLLVARRRR